MSRYAETYLDSCIALMRSLVQGPEQVLLMLGVEHVSHIWGQATSAP